MNLISCHGNRNIKVIKKNHHLRSYKGAESETFNVSIKKKKKKCVLFYQAQQHSSVEIDLHVFLKVILSHTLICEGRLSVSGERIYICVQLLVNYLEE